MTKLSLVTPDPVDVIDIYRKTRERIAATDWERVHCVGDKRPPVFLPLNWRKVR